MDQIVSLMTVETNATRCTEVSIYGVVALTKSKTV